MLVHAESKSLLFTAPNPADILSAVPAIKIAAPKFNVAARHTEASTLKLREMGYDAPSPIVSYYRWPGKFKPFNHQRKMAEFMTLHHRCFNLSEMGTAKTNAALWAADWLMQIGVIRKVLILSPLSTLERVWLSGIFETLMHRQAVIVHGSREKRKVALATDVDFYISNHDCVSIGEIRDIMIAKSEIDLIIVDEGSMFRNANTDKYKGLTKLIGKVRRLWWLTGTPCPNGPDDAWAQAKLVNRGNVPNHYGTFRRMTMMEVSEHIWKPRADGYRVAFNVMQPAIRFAKAECLDLPPVVTEDWTCELSPEQKRMFKEMATKMQTEAAEARREGVQITAMNAADRINKLRQILLGSIRIGDGEYQDIDCAPRLASLKEAIELAQAKVYVVVPFKGAIQMLERHVRKYTTTAVINGDVAISHRNRILADFQGQADPHTLLCHPKVMSHGVNATAADVLVFWGPIYSNDEYRQVIERMNRPGQTRKMTIIRIGSCPLEWAIYKMPDTREVTQSQILKLYNDVALVGVKL